MKNNYLLLHGSFSNPFKNWIPWLKKEIEDRFSEGEEQSAYTPDLPIGVGYQNYERWSKMLDVYVEAGILNENTIIFAHSIAPAFISKYLVENKIKVKRLVFVAGFNNYFGINEEYDEVNKSMYFDNLSDIKNYCNDIVCFYSDNDPYVEYEVEKAFADTITENQVMISDGGHLNAEAGYTKFEELLKYL